MGSEEKMYDTIDSGPTRLRLDQKNLMSRNHLDNNDNMRIGRRVEASEAYDGFFGRVWSSLNRIAPSQCR